MPYDLLGEFWPYLAVDAEDIDRYFYKISDISMTYNDKVTTYSLKKDENGNVISTKAKMIFRKRGIPEDYQKLIIGVKKIFLRSMLFDSKYCMGREALTGIPCYLSGKMRYNNFVIEGFSHPRGSLFVDYYGSMLEFATKGEGKSYSWVLNFYKELRDTGYLEAYKEALSDIFELEKSYFSFEYKPEDEKKRETKILTECDFDWIKLVDPYGDGVFPYSIFLKEPETDFSKISKEEKREILSTYGVSLDDSDLEKTVINARDKKSVRFTTGDKIITIDLNDRLPNLNESCTASITVYYELSKSFEKHYYDLGIVKNISDAGIKLAKKLDEELEEKDKNNKILSRLIKNVKTKQGDYSIVVEEGYDKCPRGQFVQLALHEGNVVGEKGLVSNLDSCVFTHRNNLDENSQYWQFADPKFSFSNYEVPFGEKTGSKKAMWTCSDDNHVGLIANGNIISEEYNKFLVETIKNYDVSLRGYEFDDIESGFNAVFAGIDESVIVKKRGTIIDVVVDDVYLQKGCFENDKFTIKSNTDGTITTDDLKIVLVALDELDIFEDTKKFVTQSIFTYMKSHTGDYVLEGGNRIPREDYFRVGRGPLSGLNYNSLYTLLEDGNASIVVSKILEQLNENFGTVIEKVPVLTMARKSGV